MEDRWLLEQDSEGEIYTRPHTSEALIREVLNSFDGRTIFYCCLTDTSDESCLWCVGEPKRRVIEGRLVSGNKSLHFVLEKATGGTGKEVFVTWGMQPIDSVKVQPSEILTEVEAIEVFLAFFNSKKIPNGFKTIQKALLFG